jgi:hypothetical protein
MSERSGSLRKRLASWAVILPAGRTWRTLSRRQRVFASVRGALQLAVLVAALIDLRRRPAAQVRGPKRMWVVVACVNYLGIGPLIYLLLGRRRTPS